MQAELFADAHVITVHQSKGAGEVLSGIGRGNHFSIDFGDQAGMLLAEERSSGWTLFFLGAARPYALQVRQRTGKPVLWLHSPYRHFCREMHVAAPDGAPLGIVRRRFTWIRLRYDVFDARGARLFEITRSLTHSRTFPVLRDGAEVGAIDMDPTSASPKPPGHWATYELRFENVHGPVERVLLLGALFLIDLQHFETRQQEWHAR